MTRPRRFGSLIKSETRYDLDEQTYSKRPQFAHRMQSIKLIRRKSDFWQMKAAQWRPCFWKIPNEFHSNSYCFPSTQCPLCMYIYHQRKKKLRIVPVKFMPYQATIRTKQTWSTKFGKQNAKEHQFDACVRSESCRYPANTVLSVRIFNMSSSQKEYFSSTLID